MPVKSRASAEFAADIKVKPLNEDSLIKKEATLMADLDRKASAIEEIAAGMYGLVDPGEGSRHESSPGTAGDELANDLEMQVERLSTLYDQMTAHFESFDPEPGHRLG